MVKYSKKLGKKFEDTFGRYSNNKHLPPNFINWDKESLIKVLSGLLDGDGFYGGGMMCLSSNSYLLAQQVQIIANYLDMSTSIQIDHDNGIMRYQGLKLYISTDNWKPFLPYSEKIADNFEFLKSKGKATPNVNKVSEVIHKRDFKYKPKWVYDVQTDSEKCQYGLISSKNTQLTLQSFHTGGAAGGESDIVGSFPRLKELFKVPQNLSGKATLSPIRGKVKKLQKNNIGGYDIQVGSKNLTIEPGRNPVVEEGDKVQKGDKLSDGKVKPQELGKLKSHFDAQKHITDQVSSIYGGSFHDKTIETAVRGVSDNAEITDAPEDSEFFRGDKFSASYLKKINRDREAEDLEPIKFKEYFKSIDTLNVDNPDWFTKITTNRVKSGLSKGVAKMQWTDIAGRDPVPAYLYGEDFGKPDKKRDDGGGFF